VSILAFTNDEGSGDRKPNYRRKKIELFEEYTKRKERA